MKTKLIVFLILMVQVGASDSDYKFIKSPDQKPKRPIRIHNPFNRDIPVIITLKDKSTWKEMALAKGILLINTDEECTTVINTGKLSCATILAPGEPCEIYILNEQEFCVRSKIRL